MLSHFLGVKCKNGKKNCLIDWVIRFSQEIVIEWYYRFGGYKVDTNPDNITHFYKRDVHYTRAKF